MTSYRELMRDGKWLVPPSERPHGIMRHPQKPGTIAQGDGAYFLAISPISYEHALKCAAECRQAWLRERQAMNPDTAPNVSEKQSQGR